MKRVRDLEKELQTARDEVIYFYTTWIEICNLITLLLDAYFE